MLRVIKIRMEYLEHPVGLGGLPWFGWVLDSDRKNVEFYIRCCGRNKWFVLYPSVA